MSGMIRNRRFQMMLAAGIFGVMLQSGFSIAVESIRERICINEGWSFYKYDSEEKADKLIYDVRPGVKDKDKAEAMQTVLKPWILPTGNDFIKDPAKHHVRPEGNPGSDFSFVKSGFDDSSWQRVNLPHDWAITGPFIRVGMLK